jgi:hypothetical protein
VSRDLKLPPFSSDELRQHSPDVRLQGQGPVVIPLGLRERRCRPYRARIRLLRGFFSTSARPSASSTGGT